MRFVFSVFFILLTTINAQVTFEKIFERNYSELPFGLRIENSGIYSISSFDVDQNNIVFKTYDNNDAYKFGLQSDIVNQEKSLFKYDALLNNDINILEYAESISEDEEILISKKIFVGENQISVVDKNGKLIFNNSEVAFVNVSPDKLILFSEYLDKKQIEIFFNNSLGYASIIGIDKHSNHFILTEEVESHIPLKVARKILVINSNAEVLTQLSVPMVKYLSLIKEFQIDGDGNLYHLYTEEEKLSVIKIENLTNINGSVEYPVELQKEVHFNNFVSTDEYKGDEPQEIKKLSSRLAAIKLGEKYVLHKYNVTSANLAPNNITAPDGDIIKTPPWLVVGANAKVPYKWGGFQTLEQFTGQLQYNRYAGDIHTSGVSNYAVGVDCSGFVSRCWQLTYHSATSMMPNITTQYSDWNQLRPGDAIHKVGHVRLFINRNSDGSFRIVEASARDWGVSFWSYSLSDLSSYTPRYYNNMSDDYTFIQPELLSAKILDINTEITWECDTTGVIAFNIYVSKNGVDWTHIASESKETFSTLIPNSEDYFSFRISAVTENAEGNWSNSLSAFSSNNDSKILIVDGFERDYGSGSWHGDGHTFISKYAEVLSEENISFESVSHKIVIDELISLNDYKAVYWIIGDESTIDETFNSTEQNIIKYYLENGGNFFVSGSEIGWDLSYRGSDDDKSFYSNYLKAQFVSDNANVLNAVGINETLFDGISIRFGQTYEEDYPDVISPINGSELCLNYSNNKGAGIYYSGKFGSSDKVSKLVYIAFPVETISDDSVFSSLIKNSFEFFDTPVSVSDQNSVPSKFELKQNYPNPFNPNTSIEYSVPNTEYVSLKVYDILGNEVATLVNEKKYAGSYKVNFDASQLSSGVYFYKLNAGTFNRIGKMLLIK